MAANKRNDSTLTLTLPKATVDALFAVAATCDIRASTIASALISEHVSELQSMAGLVMRARGDSEASLDEVCDLLSHLWIHAAINESNAANDGCPWKSSDKSLRAQWVEDLAVLQLRGRINQMRLHEPNDIGEAHK